MNQAQFSAQCSFDRRDFDHMKFFLSLDYAIYSNYFVNVMIFGMVQK